MKIYKFSFIEILRATVRQKRDLIVTFFKFKIKIDVTLLIRIFFEYHNESGTFLHAKS
jgi:hypothetical protein